MAGVIEIRSLEKSWAGRKLLNIDSLRLDAGVSYVLSGDNGAGKSTLLRVLAGLEPARVGHFAFRDETLSLERLPQQIRRQIGFAHQHPYMLGTSVQGNVEYGLKLRRVPRRQRAEQARAALAWAGMQDFAAALAQRLSGGEKQRVALARLKVLSPRLYLLDEPTANLDADGRRRVIELIAQLAGGEAAVLIACHDQEVINLPGVVRLHLENGKLDR
jgi:tungstate transport system ATP-binding protein